MISELRKAGPRLAGSNPRTGVIHVDLRSPEGAGSRKGSTRVRTKGSRKPGGDDHASPGLNAGEAKDKLAAEAGIHLHADPDLRYACVIPPSTYPVLKQQRLGDTTSRRD